MSGYKNEIIDILLQIFIYISSTHSNRILMSEFKNSKKTKLNTTSLNQLFSATKDLLKLLKSADEIQQYKENSSSKKISKTNIFALNTDINRPNYEHEINNRIKNEIKRYLQLLKETRSGIAAEGMR